MALLLQTANRPWSNDFFYHAASVEELARHPVHPGNALIDSRAPDPFHTPYTLAAGVVVRLTGLSPITVLGAAAIVNLLLFLWLLPLAVETLLGDRRAAPWALAFTLFAWGWQPWKWSGFFDFNSIGTVLPYPSAFAMSLLLGGVVLTKRTLDRPTWSRAAALAVLGALLLLVHPFTALGFAVIAAAMTAGRRDVTHRHWIVLAAAGAAGFVLATPWPYYRLTSLLLAHARAYDAIHRGMYQAVLARTFLAFPGVVALGARWRRDRRDPLALAFAAGAVIYVAGYVAGRESYGRILPFLMLTAQLALAGAVASAAPSSQAARVRAGALAIMVLGLVGAAPAVVRTVPRTLLPTSVRNDDRLLGPVYRVEFLDRYVGPGDIVLTRDLQGGLAAAAYGAKEVATAFPEPFVADEAARLAAVRTFFKGGDRQAVLDAYRPTHLLLTAKDDPTLAGLGKVVYRDRRYTLVRLERAVAAS